MALNEFFDFFRKGKVGAGSVITILCILYHFLLIYLNVFCCYSAFDVVDFITEIKLKILLNWPALIFYLSIDFLFIDNYNNNTNSIHRLFGLRSDFHMER